MYSFDPEQRRLFKSQTGELIRLAREFVDKRDQIFRKKGNAKRAVTPTALRNVIDVAHQATCLEEVVAFVEYQIGRDAKKWTSASNDFGPDLIAQLGEAGGVVKVAKRCRLGDDLEDEVRLEVARRWLGYVYRHYRYRLATTKD